MGLKISKFLNTTKTKLFWLYFVFGVILFVPSVMLIPIWKDYDVNVFFKNWGYNIVNIIICFAIALYLILVVFKKIISKSNKVVKILTVIEFVLLSLIALGAVFTQFDVLPIKEPGQILGFALWIRGVVEVFRAYYFNKNDLLTTDDDKSKTSTFTIGNLIVSIILISLGVVMIVTNFITIQIVLWVITLTLSIIGIVIFVLGFVKKPIMVKNIIEDNNNETTKEIEVVDEENNKETNDVDVLEDNVKENSADN